MWLSGTDEQANKSYVTGCPMKEVLIVLIVAMAVVSLAGTTRDTKIEEQKALVKEVIRFIKYVDEHKDELPPNIRERYDELEKFCAKQKGS